MSGINIQQLYEMRKASCTCKKAFIFPAFHEDGCPYRTDGMKHLDAFEQEADRIRAEEGVYV